MISDIAPFTHRRRLLAAVVIGAMSVVACDPRQANEVDGGVVIREMLEGESHAVEVAGLSRATTKVLEQSAPNDSAWRSVMAVYVDGVDSAPPAIIGRYVSHDGRVRFEPRFPFAEGVSYRVEVDTSEARAPRVIHRFSIPSVTRARTTRIVAVRPSSSELPANLLRWYVETSAPMDVGSALEHIRLLDESGREVQGAFLALDQELWDPARRRLTLLLDPGRVKRGVRTNLESGAPLVAGRRYRLVIDDAWKDGNGAALASGFDVTFAAVGDDRQSPDPSRWRLTPPSAGTQSALTVVFGEMLDHALASRLIEVVDARGLAVPGAVTLAANDSVWTFAPLSPWKSGEYSLRVDGALEDVAGNNIARVFDVDARRDSAAIERDVGGSTRSVRFRIL